ncbi:UDP-Glycosyltransferase/glycogen phosphorylase [Basidiobolus meristosporus CBS 931.73]|uniref:UDP-Glycosyltransferase/glycogen phosphorylase n=1 Tax=Basidiobolus meristosporus CBS 931.73 TaxID=1314790 RepID=A0A1Y1XPQ7_9FUNG|nr:UDP-Glycosyltransferase/glycogen phosphorylase [Basidiobolus meristosporus CBS 931.73]|eukprot:ORX87730.1 UDP-Glycosyltransferase/glycogen phosphorylase [Basidiobolus meristosporus CBS 931.73]
MIANVWPSDLDEFTYTTEILVLDESRSASTSLKVYRFSFKNMEVVAFDQEDCERVFTPEFKKHRTSWIGNEERFTEMETYQGFVRSEFTQFKATHVIFNESISLKIFSEVTSTVKVFICHACEHLSFGPFAGFPNFGTSKSEVETQRLKMVDGLWVVSKSLKEYIAEHSGIDATYMPIHPLTFGPRPFRTYDNFKHGYVTAINPGPVKGFHIFRDVAKRLPDVSFGAVKSWNLLPGQIEILRAQENISILETFRDMEELWGLTKILLVPSVWREAFGLIVVEAMLRGIPVLASNVGGLPEAKCGVTKGLIPVNMLTGEWSTDPEYIRNWGVYLVPEQDVDPWVAAITELINDPKKYAEMCKEGIEAAHQYLDSIDVGVYEEWLTELYLKNQGHSR